MLALRSLKNGGGRPCPPDWFVSRRNRQGRLFPREQAAFSHRLLRFAAISGRRRNPVPAEGLAENDRPDRSLRLHSTKKVFT
jgi:hypothetical protein